MRYYDDFRSRSGFEEGNQTVPHYYVYRDAYIQTINRFAELLGSQLRAVAFDDFHDRNNHLIRFVSLEDYQRHFSYPDRDSYGWPDDVAHHNPEDEAAMEEAVIQAMGVDVDELIFVETTLAKDFSEWLADLQPRLPVAKEVPDGDALPG